MNIRGCSVTRDEAWHSAGARDAIEYKTLTNSFEKSTSMGARDVLPKIRTETTQPVEYHFN